MTVSFKAPKATAIPIYFPGDCTKGPASAYPLLLRNWCLMTLFPVHVFTVYQGFCASLSKLSTSWQKCLRHLMTVKSSSFGVTSHHKLSDQSQNQPYTSPPWVRPNSLLIQSFLISSPILKDHTCVSSTTLRLSPRSDV